MYPLGFFCQQTVNVGPPISFKWVWRINHDLARIYQPFLPSWCKKCLYQRSAWLFHTRKKIWWVKVKADVKGDKETCIWYMETSWKHVFFALDLKVCLNKAS